MDLEKLKIGSIEIENFKNVSYGFADFSDKNESINVIGIYGQNGSGKTTIIEVISFIRSMISASRIDEDLFDMLHTDKIAKAHVSFIINNTHILEYEIELCKIIENRKNELGTLENREKVILLSETLTTKEIKQGSQPKTIIAYKRSETLLSFFPKYRFPNTKINQTRFYLAQKRSEEVFSSIIFGSIIGDFLSNSKNIESDLLELYNIIKNDIEDNLFIYSNRMSGLININSNSPIPLHFYYEDKKQMAYGVLPLPTANSATIAPTKLSIVKNVFDQINVVLPNIIPGVQIGIKELSKQLNDDGQEEFVIQVVSIRDGNTIPFRSESDGIKKIVSILSSLINAYGSPKAIVAIDELDSGIYEFLLGEILEVLSRGAQGQIIFTSHNLRPLEVLDKKNIIFTTLNPNNRYTKKTDIKPTNNMRDVYLRSIQVNTEIDGLYDPTNIFEIQKSFRRAKKIITRIDVDSSKEGEN